MVFYYWRMNMKKGTANNYREVFTKEFLMGPNSLKLLEEMLENCPIGKGSRVMDLGCGKGVTSLFVARETGSQVFATELWTPATENARQFEKWGVDQSVIPIHADANELPYADEYFDAIVSVDAYHYFGNKKGFFEEKILPFIRKGGLFIAAFPGLREELSGQAADDFFEWVGYDENEKNTFRTVQWWSELLGGNSEYKIEKCFEINCYDEAWNDWIATGHPYALRDNEFLEKGLRDKLNFIGIVIRKGE